MGKAETLKKLKCRDKRQRWRNISQARRRSFKAILRMRITDGVVLRAAVVWMFGAVGESG